MPRSAQALVWWRRAHAIARQRSTGLVLTIVLALVGAPAVSAVRSQCNLCPDTCPMHREATTPHPGKAPHLKCHAGSTASAHEAPPSRQVRGPVFSRPICGNHGIMAVTVQPPMILPAAQPRVVVAVADTAPLSDPTSCGRLADPPDTPPPIAVA